MVGAASEAGAVGYLLAGCGSGLAGSWLRCRRLYLAPCHDQGVIPTRLIAFDEAVNTTLGLPFIRTSPDHGTAFSLAGQGLAREGSMVAALLAAAELQPLPASRH